MSDQTILVTGAAGFIGFHVARQLLAEGRTVVGLDNLNSYYDPALKQARLDILRAHPDFAFEQVDLADRASWPRCLPNTGLPRWSISRRRPACAIRSTIRMPMPTPISKASSMCWKVAGIMDAAISSMRRRPRFTAPIPNCRFRSTTGPIIPISLYAATKKANELMAHSYSHLYRLPVTGLRFFTVYGPWGRPDMAIFLFTKAILEGTPIKLFNHGKMRRDFTYIDDVTRVILRLIDHVPAGDDGAAAGAPARIYNVGNQSSGRADACRSGSGEGVGPRGGQGDVADAARRRDGNLCRCRRSDARYRVSGRRHRSRTAFAHFVAWYRDHYKV